MNPYSKRSVGALTLGAFIAFGPVYAADESKKPDAAPQKSDRPAQKAERRDAPKREAGNSQKELNTCKSEAHGKDGPERANFMTSCLAGR